MFEKQKKIEKKKNLLGLQLRDSPKQRKYARVQSINVTRAMRVEILSDASRARARSNNYYIIDGSGGSTRHNRKGGVCL